MQGCLLPAGWLRLWISPFNAFVCVHLVRRCGLGWSCSLFPHYPVFQNCQICKDGSFGSSIDSTKENRLSFKLLLKSWVSGCIPVIQPLGSETGASQGLLEMGIMISLCLRRSCRGKDMLVLAGTCIPSVALGPWHTFSSWFSHKNPEVVIVGNLILQKKTEVR